MTGGAGRGLADDLATGDDAALVASVRDGLLEPLDGGVVDDRADEHGAVGRVADLDRDGLVGERFSSGS